MKRRGTLTATGLVAGLMFGSVLSGPQASASVSHSVVINSCTLSSLVFVPATTVVAEIGDQISVYDDFGGPSLSITASGATGATSISYGVTESFTITASSGSISFSGGSCSGTINFTASAGGGSASTAAAPVLETLTINASTNDTTCTGGSPTGYTGSWLQLPAADQCSQSGPNANPSAKLLGWATDPIFPVAVAQEIVDLKYGPIDDYFYGMRMIFIPAGGWTYISSSNTLYPIWAT